MAHDEPPHQDLRCLQIRLFSSLVVKELIEVCLWKGHIIRMNSEMVSWKMSEIGVPSKIDCFFFFFFCSAISFSSKLKCIVIYDLCMS